MLEWHKYETNTTGKTSEEIAANRLVNVFLDDSRRYEIAKPLLDDIYKEELNVKLKQGQQVLNKLINDTNTQDHHGNYSDYIAISVDFSKSLKAAINNQLENLLQQSK